MKMPNPKDIAEFARFALRYGLLLQPAIVAWADSVINESERAPLWAIDISLARPEGLEAALRSVPGEPQGDLPERLLLALVRRRWRRAGLTIARVVNVACGLYYAFPERYLWGAALMEEADFHEDGYITEGHLRASIDEQLASYETEEAMLPAWTNSG